MQAVKAGVSADSTSMKELAARARGVAAVSDVASLLDLLMYSTFVVVAYYVLVKTSFHWAISALALCLVAKSAECASVEWP